MPFILRLTLNHSFNFQTRHPFAYFDEGAFHRAIRSGQTSKN
jgi:hypothetical protein